MAELDWATRSPDLFYLPARRPELLSLGTGALAAPIGVTVLVCFSYPDEIPARRGLHASRQQWLAQDRLTFVSAPTDRWRPILPEPLRAVRRPFGGATFAPIVDLPAAPLQWKSVYPDRLPRPSWRRPDVQIPALFSTSVAVFGWHGVYADGISRPAFQAAQQQAVGQTWHAVLPHTTEWLPVYPDQHWTTGLRAPLHQVFSQNLDPIPNPPAPELAWGPWYPDRLSVAETLRPHLQQAWASDRIRPVSPELAWRAIVPEWLARRTVPTAHHPTLAYQHLVLHPDLRMDWQTEPPPPPRRLRRMTETVRLALPAEPAALPLNWSARYPDRFRLHQRPQSDPVQPLALTALPARVGWTASYPSLLRPRLRLTLGGSVAPVAPVIDVWCVVLSEEGVIAPTLTPESVGTPVLAEEFVLTPSLSEEAVC